MGGYGDIRSDLGHDHAEANLFSPTCLVPTTRVYELVNSAIASAMAPKRRASQRQKADKDAQGGKVEEQAQDQESFGDAATRTEAEGTVEVERCTS